MREKDIQTKIVKYLKSQGCIVIKYEQNATTLAGIPDLLFFKEGFYGAIEVKKDKKSPLRPGQNEYIDKFNEWSYGKIVYPENWEETQKELGEILK